MESSNNQCLTLDEIKAYLNKDTNKQERQQMDAHFSTCALCTATKEQYPEAMELFKIQDVNDLKETVFSSVVQHKRRGRRLFFSRVAAGILLPVIGTLGFLYWNFNASPNATTNPFDDYFFPYPAAQVIPINSDPNIPSSYDANPDEKILNNAIKAYQAGNFGASLTHFATFYKKYPHHTKANFLHGVTHLKEDSVEDAIFYLENVRNNDKALYEAANWYLALAYLKQQKPQFAKEYLNELISLKSDAYLEKAKALSNKIK
jgi:hypothetical protein